jgi:lipoprotein-anchoring transpeptidase ErfK/SrfK
VRAAALVADARDADAARAAGKSKEAAQAYSAVLLDYVRAPWKSDPALLRRWSEALNNTQRAHRWSKTGDWPSIAIQVEKGDNLIELRKRVVKDHPELLLYTGQIERANQITGAVIKPGQTLRIPTDKARMLVDLDAHWAFYLLGEEVAAAWEVGVGQENSATQVGTFRVGKDRKEQPMWFRAGKQPVPYGDPENPLGTRWIPWVLQDGQGTGLGFHGTNDPSSIGKDLSQGCIRMRNQDVEELFDILPTGAEITVQP